MATRRTLGWIAMTTFAVFAGCAEPRTEWDAAPPPLEDGVTADRIELPARTRFDASTSALFVTVFYALPVGLLAAWSLGWWMQHRRHARAEASFDPRSPLANGFAVIHGVVELEEGAVGAAIRVAIRQRGKEWQDKYGWHHSWTETGRSVSARPFRLRRADGSVVRVEPDEHVVLRDDLSRTEQGDRFDRVRVAELTPGETAHITGSLFGAGARMDAGYRSSASEPTLRPSRTAGMLVSTERPGEIWSVLARRHARWFAALAALAVALPALVFPTVAAIELTGRSIAAAPTATRHWQEYVKPKNRPGYYVQHAGVRAETFERGRRVVVADECSLGVEACVRAGGCSTLPFTVSSWSNDYAQIGRGGQLEMWQAGVLGTLAAVLLVAYPLTVVRARPWYMKRRVVEGGRGALTFG